MEIYPHVRQRRQLLDLVTALGVRPSTLRRDDCGDWAIFGKYGHIYAVPLDRTATAEGYQIVCSEHWAFAKRRLAFARVTQDGDRDGCLMLDRMPDQAESTLIRDVLGIAKARACGTPSEAQLRAREEFAARSRPASSGR